MDGWGKFLEFTFYLMLLFNIVAAKIQIMDKVVEVCTR